MNFNNDPLFNSGNYGNYQDAMRQIEEEQKKLTARYEEMRKFSPEQPRQSPIWDEIDSIVAGMSEQELSMLNRDEEYVRSSNAVNAILNREYLNIMRPVVERTRDGKEALQHHLELIKRLRKSAKDAVDRKYSMLDEYMEKYSDIPFNEYMDMKNGVRKQPSPGKGGSKS